jgi:hypothetical protein
VIPAAGNAKVPEWMGNANGFDHRMTLVLQILELGP